MLPLRGFAREALWATVMILGLAFVEDELEAERMALCGHANQELKRTLVLAFLSAARCRPNVKHSEVAGSEDANSIAFRMLSQSVTRPPGRARFQRGT